MPPLKAATTAMPEEKGACAICGEMVYNTDQRCKTLDGETLNTWSRGLPRGRSVL